MEQKVMYFCLLVATLAAGINAMKMHPSHSLAHEMFRRQAQSEGDCTVDDCIIDDGCITEESYNAGTFDPCFVETLQVGFTETSVCVYEGDGSVTLTIAINEASYVAKPVTVTYSTAESSPQSATSNSDYTAVSSGTVVFAVGELTKDITITISTDSVTEEDETFTVVLTAVDCCSELVNNTVTVTITETTKTEGDPHFTIPLKSKEILCYSIQGYAGLPFNLISNEHISINAMFVDSVNDPTEATWIGKLAIVPRGSTDYQTITFNSVEQKVDIQGQSNLDASIVQQINIHGHNNVTVKFTKGMAKQPGNPVVRVAYANPLAIFDVTFHSNHLDVDWRIQDSLLEHSHGLMGQFMGQEIDVDPVKEILIRPGFDPVPVVKTTTWQYNHDGQRGGACWKAMNPGHQGEGLIEGEILDYMVKDLLSSDFTFSKN